MEFTVKDIIAFAGVAITAIGLILSRLHERSEERIRLKEAALSERKTIADASETTVSTALALIESMQDIIKDTRSRINELELLVLKYRKLYEDCVNSKLGGYDEF